MNQNLAAQIQNSGLFKDPKRGEDMRIEDARERDRERDRDRGERETRDKRDRDR